MTTTTQSRKKLALLIGNDNYEDGEKLHCCINDALAIGNKLDKMGFDITIGVDLTYKQMILKILQFEREIKKDDLVVIFYSGHGVHWSETWLNSVNSESLKNPWNPKKY